MRTSCHLPRWPGRNRRCCPRVSDANLNSLSLRPRCMQEPYHIEVAWNEHSDATKVGDVPVSGSRGSLLVVAWTNGVGSNAHTELCPVTFSYAACCTLTWVSLLVAFSGQRSTTVSSHPNQEAKINFTVTADTEDIPLTDKQVQKLLRGQTAPNASESNKVIRSRERDAHTSWFVTQNW